MSGLNVLIVDDEPAIRQVLTAAVRKAGYSTDTAASAGEASAKLAKGDFDVVLSDIFMPVMDGIELLKHTRTQGIDVPFIMITGFASVDSAIVAIKAGAYDYITKPVHQEEIVHRLAQIEALGGLKAENKALRQLALAESDQPFRFTSLSMVEVDRLITRVAPTGSTVLITGESGTGKGLTARQILESEFFGHTKGAFTSADRARKGLFLQSDKGTIFLDEIGDLPLSMQTKLLHVIEEKAVRPLGSEEVRRVDTRIITATNRDLTQMVADGRFREDLYFRLSVFQIRLPPLRERRGDIAELVRFVLHRMGKGSGANALSVDAETEEILVNCDWPGNVRQLENVLQRAAILADGGKITVADLPPEIVPTMMIENERAAMPPSGVGTLREQVRRFELALIQRAIEESNGDRRLAAARLGIGLSSLYRKLEEFQPEVRSDGNGRDKGI